MPKNASSVPRTCATPGMGAGAASADDGAEEQFFHGFDVAAVCEEQNDVIVRLDHGVVVGHDHLVPADDGADGRPFRELDLFDALVDHAAAALAAVNDDLDGLRRATS